MAARRDDTEGPSWSALPEASGTFSTGISGFDRILRGGYRCGSFALFNVAPAVETSDLHLLLNPTWLNFLARSRGILAILPARESPAAFRKELLRYTTRRLFDSRVRVIDYVGEAEPAPYVVPLGESIRAKATDKDRKVAMDRMVAAEKAVSGARGRPFLEMNALEVMETLTGAERASKMLFFGVKRTRSVGNLGIALARPGLGSIETARGLMDYEFDLDRTDLGLEIRGRRPAFPHHVVVPDRRRVAPYVEFVPSLEPV